MKLSDGHLTPLMMVMITVDFCMLQSLLVIRTMKNVDSKHQMDVAMI